VIMLEKEKAVSVAAIDHLVQEEFLESSVYLIKLIGENQHMIYNLCFLDFSMIGIGERTGKYR